MVVTRPSDFLAGGNAGALMRRIDWSRTPLGAIESWPQSLRTTVSLMLANGHAMCLTWGPGLTFLYNDAYAPILGPRHPDAMGQSIDAVWPDVWPAIEPLLRRALAGETVRVDDLHLVMTRHGYAEDTWWSFSYSPLRDETGQIVGMIDVCVDHTEMVLADRKNDADRARQLRLFQQMPGFVAVLGGSDHVYEYVNDAYALISGRREFVGRRVRDVFPDIDGQGFYELLDQVYATGEPFSAKAMPINLAGDEAVRYIDLLYQPIRDEHGTVTGIFVGGYDITERIEGEMYRDALARLTQRTSASAGPADVGFAAAEVIGEVLRVSRVGFGTIDGTSDTLHVERDWTSPGIESLAGAVPLREYGAFINDLKRGEFMSIENVDLDERAGSAAAALKDRHAASFVNVPIVEHGHLVAVLFVNHATPRRWTKQELTFIKEAGARTRVAVERVRNELALRQLNATLETRVEERSVALRLHENIIQSDVTAICAFDTDYRLIAFNRAHNDEFFRVNGFYTQIGDVFCDLFVPEQRGVMRSQMGRALAGESFTVEEAFGNPTIDAPAWEIHYSPLRDPAGTIIGGFHHARDVSARVRAQADLEVARAALRQSQKMEAMGQLTGGVAHDFNNLLTPIVGALDLLQRKQIGGEREQRLIGGAIASAERARTLVQRLLAFARRQPLQMVAVDIAKLIESMTDLIASTTGPQICLEFDVSDKLPHAKADQNQLEMALLNLAVNARDAMTSGGRLRISAAAERVKMGGRHGLKAGRYIRLCVEDTGSGMEEEVLAQAVDPFFSTTGVGRGTGLGLSMVHGLMSQLGGMLELNSRPDEGTVVELWLPASAHAAAARPVEAGHAMPNKRGTVLLIDDEELVRLSTADMLTELGYEVIETAAADAALALIDNGVVPDLLITDHLMPGMTGSELARSIKSKVPTLLVLIISGYAESEGISPDLPRLTKPFRRDELVQSLAILSIDDDRCS